MEKSIFEHSNVFRFPEKVEYSSEGIISKRVIDRPVGTVTLFSFDQGQRLSTHSAPYDAMLQVIEGKAEIIINDVQFFLNAGEAIIMPVSYTHLTLPTNREV